MLAWLTDSVIKILFLHIIHDMQSSDTRKYARKKRLMENSGSWVPGKRRFRGGFRVLVDGRMLLSN